MQTVQEQVLQILMLKKNANNAIWRIASHHEHEHHNYCELGFNVNVVF